MGAAMAAGSHEENGNCALLVIAPIIIKVPRRIKFLLILVNSTHVHILCSTNINLKINKQSPTRFVKTVRSPETSLFALL